MKRCEECGSDGEGGEVEYSNGKVYHTRARPKDGSIMPMLCCGKFVERRREAGMRMKRKYKDRYVLATGYPWAVGLDPYTDVRMLERNEGMYAKELKWPECLWEKDVPRYRLVLERVTISRVKGAGK